MKLFYYFKLILLFLCFIQIELTLIIKEEGETSSTKPFLKNKGETSNTTEQIVENNKPLESKSTEEKFVYPSDDEEIEFLISIGVHLYDGSMVVIKRNWGDFQKDFNYPLEVVAKAMGFADLEYIGNGKLKFLNDGLGKKKGYIETTWNVYELISKVENSGWSVEYNNNAIVNSILGGHVYVILSHKGHQIVKFHFHQHGLNIFRKEKNQHFLIKNNEQLEEEPVKDPLDFYRIEYSEGEFSRKIGQVKTYLFTINELKQIAIKRVINIRKYGPGFYCYNFAYDFVHAVAKNQNNVMHLKFWPENYLEFLVYMKKSDFTFSFRAFIDPE